MKDLVIPAQSLRRELLVLAGCVLLALLINVVAIIAYETRWIELLTTWRVTLGVTLALYVVAAALRLGWAGLRRLFLSSKRNQSSVPDRGR